MSAELPGSRIEPADNTAVTLLARTVPFSITNVTADVGGDGKYVTATITGAQFEEMSEEQADAEIDDIGVIARVTPEQKVRLVDILKRKGHVVGMTGDGVNDAPALRMADVGIAMGRAGTEVARQAADLVLADDAFPTLVEALVEGRGFWGNLRRGLGLLMGGNLGEVGLLAGTAVLGYTPPLNTAQILTVNLITDALPALAVVVQEPEVRDLAGLAREGASALDARLRAEVLRRGAATAVPSPRTCWRGRPRVRRRRGPRRSGRWSRGNSPRRSRPAGTGAG